MWKLLLAALFAAVSVAASAQPAGFQPTRFTVAVEGDGPDVILIPGLSSPRAVWDGAKAALGGRYRLHLVQLNGFGGTPAGANAEGGVLAGTVAELARYIAAHRLSRPAVVGHSMGGFIGLMLARDHPARVGGLMIVDSLPFIGVLFDPDATAAGIEPRAAQMREMLRARAGRPMSAAEAAALATGMSRTPEGRAKVGRWTQDADLRVSGQAVYEVMTTDLRADLAAIRTPITMLFPWDNAGLEEARARPIYEAAYSSAPNVTLVAVGPSQHFIMLDRADHFQTLLGAFLAGSEAR